jgi:hypothetical protein
MKTEHNGLGYFGTAGFRKLSLDMLIDATKTIVRNPESAEAAFERRWLLGVEDDCAIPAPLCFTSLGGLNIDVGTSGRQMVAMIDESPEKAAMLLRALENAKARFDVVFDDAGDAEMHVVDTFRAVARPH